MLTPERFQTVRDLLEQALELAPERRSRFLDVACSSDPSLRSEVQSLLSADEQARSSFLESPPVSPGTLTPGIKLEDYEIVSQIGSGGMGVVYRAKDLRLGRDVALKVLPAHLSSDPNRLIRFEQEAKSAAALNHPNILAVYQLGNYQGAPYLVSELLEGETLREVLKGSSLPQPRVMDYAEQIADGLNAAHERGIIHRDLKPENLFVTKDHRVKILDFGLAKLAQGEPESAETVATLGLQTHPGMIAGTVGYMSPEQVRGEKLDTRTDLFSFGVVLYEMATGKRPFDGDTSGVTFEGILNRQPTPPTKVNAKVAPELERIITKALEKDREGRYQHASDIRADLKRLRRDSESGHTASHVPGTRALGASDSVRKWVGLAMAGLSLAGIAVGVAYWKGMFRRGLAETAYQNPAISSLTSSGDVAEAQISPDGKYLAYVSDRQGKHSLWLRQMSASNPVQVVVPGDEQIYGVAFSPDGTSLAYGTWNVGGLHGKVYQVPTLGGTPRLLLDAADIGVAFSPGGQQLAYGLFDRSAGQVQVMIAGKDGATPRLLYSERGHPGIDGIQGVFWFPDGSRLAAIRVDPSDPNGQNGLLAEIDLKTGKLRPIPGAPWRMIDDGAWLPDGSGLVLAATSKTGLPAQVWMVGYPSGARTRFSNDLNSYLSVSVSADGRNIVAVQWNDYSSGIWVAPASDPDSAKQITNGIRDGQRGVTFTPDDRIVFAADHAENWDLFSVDTDGANLHQLTFDGRFHSDPTVCERGQSVVYSTNSSGVSHLWRLDLRSGATSQLTFGSGEQFAACGGVTDWVYYNGQTKEGKTHLFKVSARGGNPIQVSSQIVVGGVSLSQDEKHTGVGTVGKDGTMISGTFSTATGELESEISYPVTFLGMNWMPDSRTWVSLDSRSGIPNLWTVPTTAGTKARQLTHFTSNLIMSWAYSPDGKWIAMTRMPDERNAVLFRATK